LNESGSQSESLVNKKKNSKLKYLFEEVPERNRDPKKFLGYLDEGFNSSG